MADQKVYINLLPPVNINETALIPVFQGGVTSKATAGDIIKMATTELDEKLSFVEGNLSSEIIINAEKLESKFNKEITDVNGQVTELETSITLTAELIKLEAKKEIEGVKKEIASLTVEADKITSLVERVENIEGETVINRSKIEQQADSIKSTVEYIDATNTYISTIEQTAQQIQAQVQSNDNKLGQLTLRADKFETVIAETNSNVLDFADTVSQMNHDIASQSTKLGNVEGVVQAHGTSILQTSTAISTLAARILYDEATGTITNISKSGLLTTADGNRLYTTKEEFNLNSERLLTCESSITTTAEEIHTLVQKIKFDPASGNITNISKAGIVTTSEGNEMYASKTAFNDLGQRVGYAETSIIQNSNEIVLRATKDELVAADALIRYDLLGAIDSANSQAQSLIEELNLSLNDSISSVNSSINSLSGELVNVEKELLKDISNLEGEIDTKLLEQETNITQNAEAISLNAKELTAYITANDKRVLACESNINVNAKGIEAITSAVVFNDAGEITNFARAGLVTESTYATLFAQYVEAGTGGVVKQALISAFITKNDMDEAISNIKLSADLITFEGTTIINDNFIVDTEGNLTINGTINAVSGTIGGFTIEGNSLISDGVPFIRLKGKTHHIDLGNELGSDTWALVRGLSTDDVLMFLSLNTSNVGSEGASQRFALGIDVNSGKSTKPTLGIYLFAHGDSSKTISSYGNAEFRGGKFMVENLSVNRISNHTSVGSFYNTDFVVIPEGVAYKSIDLPDPANWPGRIVFLKHHSDVVLRCGSSSNPKIIGRSDSYDHPEYEVGPGGPITAFYISDGKYWHEFLSDH